MMGKRLGSGITAHTWDTLTGAAFMAIYAGAMGMLVVSTIPLSGELKSILRTYVFGIPALIGIVAMACIHMLRPSQTTD